jgi:hypothetical protein
MASTMRAARSPLRAWVLVAMASHLRARDAIAVRLL